MNERFIILLEYSNCSCDYVVATNKVDLERKIQSYKNNPNIDHIEVVRPKTIHTWSSPSLLPATSFL